MGFICDFIIIWISAGISGKLCNHKQCGIHPMPCTTWGKIDICWVFPHKVACEMLRDGASSDLFFTRLSMVSGSYNHSFSTP